MKNFKSFNAPHPIYKTPAKTNQSECMHSCRKSVVTNALSDSMLSGALSPELFDIRPTRPIAGLRADAKLCYVLFILVLFFYLFGPNGLFPCPARAGRPPELSIRFYVLSSPIIRTFEEF